MGSTSTNYSPRTDGSMQQFFQRRLGTQHTILACGTVKRQTFYAAVMSDDGSGATRTRAWIVRLQFTRDPYYNLSYREYSEYDNADHECPERVMRALEQHGPLPTLSEAQLAQIAALKESWEAQAPASTPLGWNVQSERDRQMRAIDPDHNARAWRATNWARIERQQLKPRVRPGDTVRFKTPISMQRAGPTTDFLARSGRNGRGVVLTLNGWQCRVGNWRQQEYTVVEARR